MSSKLIAIIAGVFVLFILLSGSLFVVTETDQAIVLQFGDPKQIYRDPGLKLKVPFIQDTVFYDKRVLDLDPPIQQVILSDQKRLNVDSFVRFKIKDPLKFYQTVGNEKIAEQRLNSVVNSSLRRVLGNVTLQAVLSAERANIMNMIHTQSNDEASKFGIEVVDVRIRSGDLPSETSQAIFARMRSEREREAAEFRAQGQEQAQQIKARADRERTVILAEAEKKAQILRGEGDFSALNTLSKETSKDPKFYAFYRSLQAYKTSLGSNDTTMVLSPESEFFRFFSHASDLKK